MTIEHEKKRPLTPRLRFPEFHNAEEWEENQLSRHIEEFRKTSSVQDEFEVLTSARGGLIKQKDYYANSRITERSNIGFNIIPVGYLTYRSRSDDRQFFFNENNLGITGIVSIYYPVFRINDGCNKFFLELFSRYSEIIGKHSIGTSQTVLSLNDLRKIKLPLPVTEEQQRIADCLSSLDERITTETRKLDALKAHKKGLLEQIFPLEGETVPRLRFPGFREKWKRKNISSCIQLISGLHLSPDEYGTIGEIPYFTGPSDFTNNTLNITKWTKRSSNTANPNDILITVKGSGVGELWYLTLPCVAMGRQLMAIRAEGCLSQFMYQILTTKIERFKALASGNLIPGLSRKDILDMKLHFPSLPEQQKIANCLSSLDELAASQTQKIDLLKTHKKGLMQQLFPALDEVQA